MNSEVNMRHSKSCFFQLFSILLFFPLYPLFITLSISFASPLQCHHEERNVLLKLKDTLSNNINASATPDYCYGSFSDPPYPKILHWKENTDCCSWDGIECDEKTGHVISINLRCSQLQGSLPTFLGNLTQITRLDLSFNEFSGSIPASLGNLTQLSILLLLDNNFNGDIPSSLSKMEHLEILHLRNNHFSGSIPVWIGNLTQLYFLHLSDNNFSGHIPTSLSKLEDLTFLYLSNNDLWGPIPTWLGNLTNARHLDLSVNNFSSQIPSSILNLENLGYLNLSINHLSGSFPSSGVEQLPNRIVTYLDLRSNMLQGALPVPSFSIAVFLISNNNFSGNLPHSICNASSLEIVDFANNGLGGMIPQCLGNLSELSVLDLRMNNFRGIIPRMFLKGNSLRNLNLNGNQMEGKIPKSLKKCKKLEVLDFGNNKINDTFPHWLDTLPELQVLMLRSNRLHGPIRDSKTRFPFPKLRIIDLSNNEFIGPLPMKYFKTLKAMMNVDEKINTGPRYMGDRSYYQDSVIITIKGSYVELVKILTIYTTLDLSNNRFQGEIPKSIGNLTSLRLLNFSHNYLTGHIPSSLGNMRNLESLDLSSNYLFGEIPGQLTNLTFLEFLNLSQNHLKGPIPRGKQFDTFVNNSYEKNLGLCGLPLSKYCGGGDEVPQKPPSIQKEEDSEYGGRFGWKTVLIGYGSGMVVGLAWGYYIFLTRNPKWLFRIVEGIQHRKMKKSTRSVVRRWGGRRN